MVKKTTKPSEGTLPITVSSEVVSHLSLGLYRNFAKAVKELISNSYDAGATKVKIKLDLDKELIIVRDNGRGMSLKEIEKKFLNIALRTPLTEKVDELGRKRIGSFGIGFLSTFPYCKELELITKKKNSDEIIEVSINTEPFFKGIDFQLSNVRVPYKLYKSDVPFEDGETIILLKKIAPHIIEELKEKAKDTSTIEKVGGFEKFKWTLAQYAPIEYPEKNKELGNFFRESKRVPMHLWLNAEELSRNVPDGAIILEKGEANFGRIKVKYAILTPKKPIKPKEAVGLQIRLRDVAIGFPTDFDIIKETGYVPGKLSWLCGEIQIINGLESALMIDRDSFSFTEEVADLQEYFRKILSKWNRVLESWAEQDKTMLGLLKTIENSDDIIEQFKETNLLRLSEKRFKTSKSSKFMKSKKQKPGSVKNKLKDAISKNKDYTVIESDEKREASDSPIQVNPEEKTVIIYDTHPSFVETIELENQKFNVSYDKWDIKNSSSSICKIQENEVIYNRAHPIFQSEISDEIVKKLSLGFLLIVQNQKIENDLVIRFNKLLEEVFLRV